MLVWRFDSISANCYFRGPDLHPENLGLDVADINFVTLELTAAPIIRRMAKSLDIARGNLKQDRNSVEELQVCLITSLNQWMSNYIHAVFRQ